MDEAGARILIVDDEKDFCEILFHVVKKEGFTPLVAHDGFQALEMVRLGIADLLILDVKMPGMDGMEVLRRAKQLNASLPVLMITAYGGVDGAVKAMKCGAFDYLTKPVNNRALMDKVKLALGKRRVNLRNGGPSTPTHNSASTELREMMGPSQQVRSLISSLLLVASSEFTVVIQGETGTGKELLARAIHKESRRSRMEIVPVDCGSIPEGLFESELFGHEKGAFTGAVTTRPGKFEIAQGGTLFLDEVGNMPLSCQTKLLRAIQERTLFRVGGRQSVAVDVRLLVATNRDLALEVSKNSFSRDLFYRLSEFTITIPALRNRKDDIIHLSDRFLKSTNLELGKNVQGFSDSAKELLLSYDWPGNVRELKSCVRRAVLQADDVVRPEHLFKDGVSSEMGKSHSEVDEELPIDGLSLKEIVRRGTAEIERRVLTKVLQKTHGNKAKAARLLQIDYKTIHYKIKQYGIKLYPEEEDE